MDGGQSGQDSLLVSCFPLAMWTVFHCSICENKILTSTFHRDVAPLTSLFLQTSAHVLQMQHTAVYKIFLGRRFGYGTCEVCWTVNVTVWCVCMFVCECVWLCYTFCFFLSLATTERKRLHPDTLALQVTTKRVVLILHLVDAISTPTQLLHWRRTDTQTRSTLDCTLTQAELCKEQPCNDCWADVCLVMMVVKGGGLMKGDCCDLTAIVASSKSPVALNSPFNPCAQPSASDSKRHKHKVMEFHFLVCQHSVAQPLVIYCIIMACLKVALRWGGYYTFSLAIFIVFYFILFIYLLNQFKWNFTSTTEVFIH